MASFLENIVGSPGKVMQANRFSPGQQGLQNQLLSQVSGLLGNQQKNRFDFAPVANDAKNRFYTETIPSIAERFTAMGGSGSQNGSAFQGALGSAGAGLEKGLASLQAQFGLQQQGLDQQQLNSLLSMAFQSPYENIYQEGQEGLLGGITQGLSGGFGRFAPDAIGGLLGLITRLFSSRNNGQQQGSIVPPENTPGARL